MKPRARHAPQAMTSEYNQTQAFMKVTTAPLHTLTPAMLESIARTHCGRREGAFGRMLGELQARVDARREREGL